MKFLTPVPIEVHRQALLARIHRRYQTVTAVLRIGDADFTFTRIADPDKVLDETAAEEDRREKLGGIRYEEPLHLPYWAEVWDSAGGLGQLLRKRGRLDGINALDLGCGQGLSGCIAASLGARVMFADLEAPALLFARLNGLPFAKQIRTRQLNWQTDHLNERFDLILGADILYDKKQWQWLEPFWREHLASDGMVMLSEPGRPTGEMFLDWVQPLRWSVESFAETVPTRNQPIRIFQLCPAGNG